MKVYELEASHCDPQKIGISYSGGSHRGILHLGTIKAFIELKIVPDRIVGVSAGSFAAAIHAFNPSSLETVDLTKGIAKKLKPEDFGLNFTSIAARTISQGFSLQSIGSFEKFKQIIESSIPFQSFDQAQVPFEIATTDWLNGQQVWLNQGSVIDAFEASSALPGIFPPVKRGEAVYVDGGITDGQPLLKLAENGCGTIFAVNAGYSGEIKNPPKNLLVNLLGSIDISLYQADRYEAALLKALYPDLNVVEIRPNVAFNISLTKFTTKLIDQVVEESYQKSLQLLEPYAK